jgi:RNA polymerase sigma-70 factor (ECF subfamily)
LIGDVPDTELLSLARQGRDDALAELFRRHREPLRRALALRLGDRLARRVDVSDVLQETYLEAARRLPDYLSESAMPFYLWLRWLAREQLLMCRRRHLADKRDLGREAFCLPIDSSAQFVNGLVGREPSPSQAVAAEELAERLHAALQRLDDDEREIILMRHFEHLTNREIAQLLDITDAAANKRYIRALQRLRGMLIN